MNPAVALEVRAAVPGDRPFISQLASRLADTELPPWRTPEEVAHAEGATLEAALQSPSAGASLLVAVAATGELLGVVYLQTAMDYFRGRAHGHIAILVVAPSAEGRGVATELMAAAESWARARGFDLLTLNVFEGNVRARRLYQRLGYGPETVRYVKPL